MFNLVEHYLKLGIHNITLADTTGMANPVQVKRIVSHVLSLISPEQLTLHFHNTRGLGLTNVLAAYEVGARRFDAALGGLGGCPFARGLLEISVLKIWSICVRKLEYPPRLI